MADTTDLQVTGLTIESLYNNYTTGKYRVNRRYQRKLVWSLEDKERLIESVIRKYPIPLILFADVNTEQGRYQEIIDGMQRINAIIYFLENRISYNGEYFDLNTLSATKAKLDSGDIAQQEPVISRDKCLEFASYIIPSSVYEFTSKDLVDEVFKRINSMGRYLSRQELRVAGSTSDFATLIRRLSANVRGDSSQSDIFPLDKMPHISLAFSDEDVGIAVQDIFWVRHGIITREWLRESRDEELVCDIVASIALTDMPPSNADVFNDYYGYPRAGVRTAEIGAAISRIGPEVLESRILAVLDEIKKMFAAMGATFAGLCFSDPPPRSPRYFTAMFLAVYYLMYEKMRIPGDYIGLKSAMLHACDSMDVSTGGNWSAANKERARDQFCGMIDRFCIDREGDDPAGANWTTKIENLLNQSMIEQQLYDFKLGFTDLSDSPSYQRSVLAKIIQTLIAMCNLGRGNKGYVVIGICDKPDDAKRVNQLHGVESLERYGHYVVGINHDAAVMGQSLDSVFTQICQHIDEEPVDDETKKDIKSRVKLVSYQKLPLIVFELISGTVPRLYDGHYYIREGTSNKQLDMTEVAWLFSQFKV